MTSRTVEPLSEQDRRAVAALHAHGYRVPDIQSLAKDQRPFATRLPARRRTVASGVSLRCKTVDLGEGSFTNVYTLSIDLDLVRADVRSAAGGFHLRDHIAVDAGLAAVSGSFAFISDDSTYQPTEPCLDFCYRAGEIVSLPTATKPTLLVRDGRPVIETLNAAGSLTLGGQPYRWIGSKNPSHTAERRPGTLAVFGASNCKIRYSDHPRTGFIRHVDPRSNITPPDSSVIDYVVANSPGGPHRVIAVQPGGGTDLFAGNFVLRGGRLCAGVAPGTPVEITDVGGRDARHLESGISLGPSVADAAAGNTPGYDACLGASPFRDARRARTLVGLHGQELVLHVLDGAPMTDTFRGVTPREAAQVCEAEELDPCRIYHLDGGASSKIAFLDRGTARVVGSMHYLNWPTRPSEPFRWQGLQGRVLRSALVLTPHRREELR